MQLVALTFCLVSFSTSILAQNGPKGLIDDSVRVVQFPTGSAFKTIHNSGSEIAAKDTAPKAVVSRISKASESAKLIDSARSERFRGLQPQSISRRISSNEAADYPEISPPVIDDRRPVLVAADRSSIRLLPQLESENSVQSSPFGGGDQSISRIPPNTPALPNNPLALGEGPSSFGSSQSSPFGQSGVRNGGFPFSSGQIGGNPFGSGSLAVPPGLLGAINAGNPQAGGIPGLSGLGGLGALAGLGGGIPGQGGIGGLPQAVPGGQGGLLSILSGLGGQLGRSLGVPSLGGANGLAGPSGFGGIPIGSVPNVPGVPLLGQPGQFDITGLIASLSRRALNGSSVADAVPPEQLQGFADNVTDQLLPELPEVDLAKYMGRWFEGLNSPKATTQRCVVHHYGGLTENEKTSTYTALKIYRDGSEFGQVQYSIGYAFRGGRKDAMMQMHSSESGNPTPYWIYNLGPITKDPFGNPQYEYAVISNWIKYPLMVLVRDPDRFHKEYYVDVLRWLEDNQFITPFTRAFNLVQSADYSNCQYEDSTFAAFG